MKVRKNDKVIIAGLGIMGVVAVILYTQRKRLAANALGEPVPTNGV